MGIRERWRALWGDAGTDLEPARRLELLTGFNVRELGGYAVREGVTSYRRFIRSGGLDMLSSQDQKRLYDYGVRLVLDLRGDHEVSLAPDHLAHMPNVRFMHVPLYDIDLSDPRLTQDSNKDFRAMGYLTMLSNHEAVRRVFEFFASAGDGECVLFHCAAGMDRTGVCAMLLLGLAGASRERIVADYCYSFGSTKEVDGIVFKDHHTMRSELQLRLDTINGVIDCVEEGYGTIERYLVACGIPKEQLSVVRSRLCE